MRSKSTAWAMLAAAAALLVGCGSPPLTLGGQYTAMLSGGHEVPPVKTSATGTATFRVAPDGKSIHYKVVVNGIDDVTMAHLHLGVVGENGDHVVWLYPSAPPPKEISGVFSGTLAQGKITPADFMGPLKGKSMKALTKKLAAGDVYVNVHTKQHPDGEIRGQVVAK